MALNSFWRKVTQEKEKKNAIDSGPYVLPEMINGSALTLN
jgi:hypothetical protein